MVLGLDAGVLTLAALIAVIALVVFVNGILIPEAGNWFLDAIVKMPRFEYRYQGGEQGNENWVMYRNLRTVAFMILAIAMTYSAVILVGEEFEVFRKGEAFSTLAKGIISVVIIFTFPPMWDLLASGMEGLAKYVLNPTNPNQAQQKVSQLMQHVGGIVPPNIDWNDILQFLTDPQASLQTIFRDVFMAVFKAFIAAMLVVLMFIIGTVRIVLTGVLAIALPLILSLSIVPFFDRVMGRLKDILIGLTLAPVLSALAVSAGLALMNSTAFSPLQEWFAAVAVAFLAVMFPVIVAPVLGSIVSSLTTVATGGMLAGLYLGSQAVMGAVGGGYRAVSALREHALEQGITYPISTYAKAAMAGAKAGFVSGTGAGVLHSFTEGLQTTGFGKLAEPVMRLERKAEQAMQRAGLDAARSIIQNYTGSVTEGLLPWLATEPVPRMDADTAMRNYLGSKQFANRIADLARQNKYEDIADIANSYLQFKSIPNKAEFGKAFAEQIEAYSKNSEALGKIYYNLQKLKEKGGVSSLSEDQLLDMVFHKDMHRKIASNMYGIEIPDPEFEAADYLKVPQQVQANIMKAYPVKYTFGNLLNAAMNMPKTPEMKETGLRILSTDSESTGFKRMIARNITEMWSSQGITIDNKAKYQAQLIAAEIGNQIVQYDPETIGAVAKLLETNEYKNYIITEDKLTKEIHDTADKLMPNVHLKHLYLKARPTEHGPSPPKQPNA